MTVLALPERKEEVPRFLMGAVYRVKTRAPKSVFGYLGDVSRGVFVTNCDLRIGLDGEVEFAIEGITFEGEHAYWAGRVDDIVIERLEDSGYHFTAGLKPALTLYL